MFNVAVTAIIQREDGRVLITRRSPSKKKWPCKWTVDGLYYHFGGFGPFQYRYYANHD